MVKNCKSCGEVFETEVRNRQLCDGCRTFHFSAEKRKKKKCERCGRIFEYKHKDRNNLCRQCQSSIKQMKYNAREYGDKKSKKNESGGSLFEDVKKLEDFNKKHGTLYSYGQAKSKGII